MNITEAAVCGHVQELRQALGRGEDANSRDGAGQSVLSIVAKCRPDLVRMLLENGADANRPDANGVTPLHWAVEYDNAEIVALLLEHGASTRAVDGLRETPLHWAAWTGHRRSAEKLLAHDPRTDFQNHAGRTPMDLAVQ